MSNVDWERMEEAAKHEAGAIERALNKGETFKCHRTGEAVTREQCLRRYIGAENGETPEPCKGCGHIRCYLKKHREKKFRQIIQDKRSFIDSNVDPYTPHVTTRRDDYPSVKLHEEVMALNKPLVQDYGLDKYGYVSLNYNREYGQIIVGFSNEKQGHLTLSTRPQGDAKVSITGFRKNHGLDQKGRFDAFLFDEDARMLVIDLTEGDDE